MSKFIKVVDSPVVSSAIPPLLAADGPRVFSYSDSSNTLIMCLNAVPKHVRRLVIPCDNSLGTSVMTVFLNGFFGYEWGVDNDTDVVFFNTWTELRTAANSQSSIVYTNDVTEKTGMSGADSYVLTEVGETFYEQTLFLDSFSVQPGAIVDHYLDLFVSDRQSFTFGASSVQLHPVAFWMQGYVVI